MHWELALGLASASQGPASLAARTVTHRGLRGLCGGAASIKEVLANIDEDCPGDSFAAELHLVSPINVLDANYVVFAEVAANLHLDQL